MAYFVEKFSQKSSIIRVWQSAECASNVLQNSHSENHPCWRSFSGGIVRCVCNVAMRLCTSTLTRDCVSAFLVQFLLRSTFRSQILDVFRNPLMKSYLFFFFFSISYLELKKFWIKDHVTTRDKYKFDEICGIWFWKICSCVKWSFLFISFSSQT